MVTDVMIDYAWRKRNMALPEEIVTGSLGPAPRRKHDPKICSAMYVSFLKGRYDRRCQLICTLLYPNHGFNSILVSAILNGFLSINIVITSTIQYCRSSHNTVVGPLLYVTTRHIGPDICLSRSRVKKSMVMTRSNMTLNALSILAEVAHSKAASCIP